MTAWEKHICPACRKPNHAHRDDDLNEQGECLAGAKLPSRPAYDVKCDTTAPVRLALASMVASANDSEGEE